MKKREVYVCPVCNSQDVEIDTMFKFEHRAGLMRRRCNNCGFIGPMTVMEKKHADRLKVLKTGKKQAR